MTDPQTILRRRLIDAITAAFGPDHADTDPLIRPAQNPRFGDYQANVAMGLAKGLGRPPREVAASIVAQFDASGLCEVPEIAGPGFINIRLLNQTLEALAAEMAADPRLGVARDRHPMTVVVDYSSPNVAKQMHVGHLRSTVIGDALARTLAFLGHEVVRQNHIGDWGTQFGMLIQFLEERGGADGHQIEDLDAFYREAKARFDSDGAFNERARRRVVLLQGGDEATLALWRELVAESQRHFFEVYERLGVELRPEDVRGESSYNPMLDDVLTALEEKGMTERSDGATCVFLDGFTGPEGAPLPLIVRKSDGGFLYATTDLAAIRYRVDTLKADRVIYVTDDRQKQHFEMVFAAARRAGFAPPSVALDHVWFGKILGSDNRPFRSREGQVMRLAELLDEAESRAAAIVAEKNPELGPDERRRVARVVGIGAVKYADLSGDRAKDYVFSWDRMLAMEGNTAPYLQYAYARIRSIVRRAAEAGVGDASDCGTVLIGDDAERALVLQLVQMGPVLDSVARSLEPHRLCGWLYDLATAFSAFYERCPVLRAEDDRRRAGRLKLCEVTASALRCGLGLLGIEVPERM